MKIIDGKKVASVIKAEIAGKVASAGKSGKTFRLAVVLIGNDPASEIYVGNKAKACEEVGIVSETVRLPETAEFREVESVVKKLAEDDATDGILVQLPLPAHLDEKKILSLIPPEKDVDGFTSLNAGKSFLGENCLRPCTPSGIIKLLDYYGIEIEGKRAVVVGRSNIVGKPVALMLLERNSTVTVCHSKTRDLADVTRTADVLVVAVGKKGLITGDMIKEGAVVIDAGINRADGKIYGDVDFETAKDKVSYITPVPGGVGPMTIAMLLYNTYLAGINR